MALKFNNIIDARRWPRRKMQVGYGTRDKVVLKQTNRGKVYFMAKTYSKDVGELRSEVCASIIGRFFDFPVQTTWFCLMPPLKKFPHEIGVLVQLDIRRQRDTRRNQFKENLIHGGGLIGLVDKNFARLKSEKDRRRVYTLDLVIKSLRKYASKNSKAKIIWRQFFELLVFDALIGGTDRHYNNWGILEKADDAKFIRLAPAFDNGISLLWKIEEYGPKFMREIFTRRFALRAESMFKKKAGGKYNLFDVLEAFYSLPELRNSGSAKEICDRLNSKKIIYLKTGLLRSTVADERFQTKSKELSIIYEYVKIRLEELKMKLNFIDSKYG